MIPLPDFSDPEDLLEVCQASDLKLLGKGAYRNVYSLGNGSVLKVATKQCTDLSYSEECNRREADIWAEVKETPYAGALAEVIAVANFAGWLIMEEAGPTLTQEYAAKNDPKAPSPWVVAGTAQSSVSGPIPNTKRRLWAEDLHGGNVARRPDGSLVVLDYGNFSIEDAE